MKKQTILKNNGFSDQSHFFRVTGISANYQARLHGQDMDFFKHLVESYAHLTMCDRCDDTVSVTISGHGCHFSGTVPRRNLIDVYRRSGMSREGIKMMLLADIPSSFGEVAERQSSDNVDQYDITPGTK